MTSKLRIENITDEADKLTVKIIQHFTKGVKGNGYFYKDQDWNIMQIVTKHLEQVKLTDKAEPQYVILLPGHTMSAKPGATGIMTVSTGDPSLVNIAWDQNNPFRGAQQDGNYYRESFKIIDKATYDKISASLATVTELIKNVS